MSTIDNDTKEYIVEVLEKNKQLLELKSKQYENSIEKAEDHLTIGSLLLRNNIILKEIDRIDKAKESILSL